MRLLLFDIDGTLIKGDQAGRLAMGAALEQMFGTKGSLDSYQMAGKTDMRIMTDLLGEVGVDPLEIQRRLPEFFVLMAEFAQEIYPTRNMMACPGIASLLVQLRDRDSAMVGLLTGNARSTAPLKLEAAGIDPSQFVVGAYGSEDLDRNSLPNIALRRANELTTELITSDNAVVIGDTPADVQCARAGKTRAVAVASGWHSASTLSLYQPDYLFADLSDTEAVLQVLLG